MRYARSPERGIRRDLERTAPAGTVSRLGLRLERGSQPGPQVRLLLNGRDPLGTGPFTTGNNPRELFDSGALLPVDPTRRVGLYGCACGIFGCSALTALVECRSDQILWHRFYSFSAGEYDGPLPEDSTWPDPVDDPEPDDDLVPRPLHLPTITFAAEQYLLVVSTATDDWSSAHGRSVDWT